jgi:hypothetical protein
VKDATIGRNSPITTGRTDGAQHPTNAPCGTLSDKRPRSLAIATPRFHDPALARRVPIGSSVRDGRQVSVMVTLLVRTWHESAVTFTALSLPVLAPEWASMEYVPTRSVGPK